MVLVDGWLVVAEQRVADTARLGRSTSSFDELAVNAYRLVMKLRYGSDETTRQGQLIVGKYWLLDQHGEDGPTALVETNGSMNIVRILQFGPGITGLDDQQVIQDRVVGQVAPKMKPLVQGSSIVVDSVEPHEDLRKSFQAGKAKAKRSDRGGTSQWGRSGPSGGGAASRSGGRGDR